MKKTLLQYSKHFLSVLFLAYSSVAFAQIKGKVTDSENGEPLVGAYLTTVEVPGGAITDEKGEFTMKVNEGAKNFKVSYIGYTSRTFEIGNQTYFDIQLTAEDKLDEVLVIGYSVQKKSDKTGAVTQVSAEELNKGRLTDPIQGLQGKAAGVNVSKQGGDPNAGFSVNIRGAAGLTSGTGPLYVVDGVVGVDPTTINPDDIESFNVLKDAASAAIYGSRAANGVIIITTKNSGIKSGGSMAETFAVEYSSFVSLDRVANRLNFLDADQIKEFAAQDTSIILTDNGGNVDWMDEIYRTGVSSQHTLAFSGMDANTSYRASFSSNSIAGVIKGTDKDRYIGRLNITQKALNDKLTLNARLSTTIEKNDYITYGDGDNPNNVIYQAMRRSPLDPVYTESGDYFETDRNFQYNNPVAIIEQFQNQRDAKRLLGNFGIDYQIIDGLNASVNMAYIRDDEESFYFEPSFAAANNTQGLGRREYKNRESLLIEEKLNYIKTFKEKHNINVMAGHSYQVDNYDGFKAEGKNAQSNFVQSNNLQVLLDLEPGSITSYKDASGFISLFARSMYDFDKHYFLTLSVRRDYSSRFGDNNEWGWFPAVSAAWNLKKEAFIAKYSTISDLRLRVGYGVTGNQSIPNNVDRVSYVPAGTAIDPETGETVISFERNGDIVENPDLKWEQNGELNIGVDFGLWKNKISGSIEYYRKTTSDLIYKYELPVPPNKARYIYANAGELQNNGIEATIQSFIINNEKMKWKSVLTFAHNKQKTVTLSSENHDLDEIRTLFVDGRGLVGGENWTQKIVPGYEIGTFFLPEYAGLTSDGKGQFLFYTAAGGVTRDVTKAERRAVGSAQPDFIAGWSNYFEFKNGFDVSFSFRAVVGHQVYNVTRMIFSNPADLPSLNVLEEALDEYDRGLQTSPIVSSYYLENGSFLKLDNMSVGYNIPVKDKIKNLRVYLNGNNLLLITGYSGLDPELNYSGFEFGRDQYDVYPRTRSITFGLNASF